MQPALTPPEEPGYKALTPLAAEFLTTLFTLGVYAIRVMKSGKHPTGSDGKGSGWSKPEARPDNTFGLTPVAAVEHVDTWLAAGWNYGLTAGSGTKPSSSVGHVVSALGIDVDYKPEQAFRIFPALSDGICVYNLATKRYRGWFKDPLSLGREQLTWGPWFDRERPGHQEKAH